MNGIRQRTARIATLSIAAATVLGGAALVPAAATGAPATTHTQTQSADALGAGNGSTRVAAGGTASAARALTVNFNNVPSTDNPIVTHLSTNGFNFDGLHFHTIDNPGLCNLGGCVSNGTTYIAEEEGGVGQPFTMTRANGGKFRLAKVSLAQLFLDDAAAANAGVPNATSVTLTGTLASGGTLTQTFGPSDVGFVAFSLPSNWKNLVSVRFAPNGAFAADTIKVVRGL